MPNDNISEPNNPPMTIKRIELNEKLKPYDDILFKKSGFKKCIQCGRCTASCPAAYLFPEFNPRKLMRKFMFLDIYSSEINEIIWKCGQCYSCRARCPRNCKAGLGIQSLQIRSLKVGKAPKERINIAKQIKVNLYACGEVFIPSMFNKFISELGTEKQDWYLEVMAKRKSVGFLPNSSRPSEIPVDALEEVRKILQITGFLEVA
jgi:heterodisulfide reductase subunit C1